MEIITGGSGDEQTLRANRAALDAVTVVPRVLSGVGGASAATVLVASPSEFPAAVAPVAYQRLVHPDGEVALARS